jgi:NDP-sugar pyrophosphorylase family protein/aminoglycoside/choline kinase family phosphotransferase
VSAPRKAFILAAGYGTRLEPLTHRIPKCLVPLWNRPLLDHTLEGLRAWGVRDVLINLHHAADAVFDVIRRGFPGLRLQASYEPDILGTGGALRRARWFLGSDPLWILNGDIVVHTDPAALVRAFRRRRALAVLLMSRTEGPRTVDLAPDGTIASFRSAHPGAPGTATFCGLQLVHPRLVDHLPDADFSTIVAAYEHAQRAGEPILGIADPHLFWMDIGTPEGLLAAHARTAQARAQRQPAGHFAPRPSPRHRLPGVSGFAAIAPDARIARGARLHNVVIMAGATIQPNARIADAIIAPRATIHGPATRLVVPLASVMDPPLTRAVAELGWPAATTSVQPLSPRGSNRTYTRIACATQSALVVRYSMDRPENARFTGHARFLATLGIRVPRIRIDHPTEKLYVMDDLGHDDLQAAVLGASPATRRRLYAPVMRLVARLHAAVSRVRPRRLALEPAFNPRLYAWEHTLFRDQFLVGRLGLAPADFAPALAELHTISNRLAREPRVLLHRDLQSSNILLTPHGPALIDFQGMRLGPAVYDLASLLADPYVMLDEPTQRHLLLAYARLAGLPRTDRLERLFWAAVVQRLVQAIGAYARLSRLPGTTAFARHIPPALAMLDRALGHLYTSPRMHELVRELQARSTAEAPPP